MPSPLHPEGDPHNLPPARSAANPPPDAAPTVPSVPIRGRNPLQFSKQQLILAVAIAAASDLLLHIRRLSAAGMADRRGHGPLAFRRARLALAALARVDLRGDPRLCRRAVLAARRRWYRRLGDRPAEVEMTSTRR